MGGPCLVSSAKKAGEVRPAYRVHGQAIHTNSCTLNPIHNTLSLIARVTSSAVDALLSRVCRDCCAVLLIILPLFETVRVSNAPVDAIARVPEFRPRTVELRVTWPLDVDFGGGDRLG
jgi:hypothetical protein